MKVVRYIDDRGKMVAKVVPDETVITTPQPLPEPEPAPLEEKKKKRGKK